MNSFPVADLKHTLQCIEAYAFSTPSSCASEANVLSTLNLRVITQIVVQVHGWPDHHGAFMEKAPFKPIRTAQA